MGKNEIYWAIFKKELLQARSIRRTKKECLNNHRYTHGGLWCGESCRKVMINEYKKEVK